MDSDVTDELQDLVPFTGGTVEQLSVFCGLEEKAIKEFVEEIREESIKMMIQEENVQLEVEKDIIETAEQNTEMDDQDTEMISSFTKDHIQRMSVVFGLQDEKMNEGNKIETVKEE